MSERAKCTDQGPPQYGVAISPGGADREAEYNEFHCGSRKKLSRDRDQGRLTLPQQLFDITFESNRTVGCRVPREHVFTRSNRNLPPFVVGKLLEIGEHLLRRSRYEYMLPGNENCFKTRPRV